MSSRTSSVGTTGSRQHERGASPEVDDTKAPTTPRATSWSYDDATKQAVAAFGAPGALEKTVKLPFGELPGAAFMGLRRATCSCTVDLARRRARTPISIPSFAAQPSRACGRRSHPSLWARCGRFGEETAAPAELRRTSCRARPDGLARGEAYQRGCSDSDCGTSGRTSVGRASVQLTRSARCTFRSATRAVPRSSPMAASRRILPPCCTGGSSFGSDRIAHILQPYANSFPVNTISG